MVAIFITISLFVSSYNYAMAALLAVDQAESASRTLASDKECKFIAAAAEGKITAVNKYLLSK